MPVGVYTKQMVITNVQLGQFESRLKLFFKLVRLYIAYVYNKRHYKIGHISLLLKVPLFVINSKLNVYILLCNHFIILIIPDVLFILLFMFQVAHSMRIHVKPLDPWLIVSDGGSVQSAHCTFMAGLSEGCSHIAAVLFAMENGSRITKEASVIYIYMYLRTGCFQHLQSLRHRSNGSVKWTSLPHQRNVEH